MCHNTAIWRQISVSSLAQVMACCLTVPSRYLHQCWLIISEVFWLSPGRNFTGNAQHIYPRYAMSLEITNIILQAKLPGTDAIIIKNVTFSGVSSIAWHCTSAISHMHDIRIPTTSSCYCNQNMMCDKTAKLHDKWHKYNINIATICRVHSRTCEKVKKRQIQGIHTQLK